MSGTKFTIKSYFRFRTEQKKLFSYFSAKRHFSKETWKFSGFTNPYFSKIEIVMTVQTHVQLGIDPLIFSQLSDFWWLVIGDWWLVIGDWWFTQKRVFTFFLVIGDSPGDSPGDWWFSWWFTFFGFSVSITNCKSPEKKVGSLLTLIISNCQSPKMFCLFFTFNSHLSIANFFITL